MIIKEYLETSQRSPFEKWFNNLNIMATAKITTALYRLEQGNNSNVKSVGEGVLEYKIYFGIDEKELIILLGGGSKKQQNQNIIQAKQRWAEYKKRKNTNGDH